jgi:hypothetical protein
MGSLSDGIINSDFPPVDLHPGALLFGSPGVVNSVVVNEGETARTTGLCKTETQTKITVQDCYVTR